MRSFCWEIGRASFGSEGGSRWFCFYCAMFGGSVEHKPWDFSSNPYSCSVSIAVRVFLCMTSTFHLSGFGSGLSYSPSFGVLPLYFRRRRNFATAIVTAGNGVGIFIFPFLFRYLIDSYSWRGAMFINAGIALNVIPCGAVIFKRQPRISGGGLSQFAEFTLFREPAFYYSLSHFFLMGSIYIFSVLCIRYASDKTGVSKDEAPLLLVINGATNIAGRTLVAVFSTNQKIATVRNRFILLHVFSIAVALTSAAYAMCTNFTAICVVAGLVGISWGTKFALVPGLTLDILSAKRFNAAWGYLLFVLGISFLVFPPLGSKYYCIDSELILQRWYLVQGNLVSLGNGWFDFGQKFLVRKSNEP